MKRLVLCLDGAWDKPDQSGSVLDMAETVAPLASDGIHQVIRWQDGCTLPSLPEALTSEILSAYRFLVHNYSPGDQIWLFGFSRGAYVARSLVGLLRNAGLLHREHGRLAAEAYRIYRTRWRPDATNAVEFRARHSRPVPVRFLGIWDAVGDNGIPAHLAGELGNHGFRDRVLSHIVEHACHALAIDETRADHPPCLWRTVAERSRTEQCWFAGGHDDIGGLRGVTDLSVPALRWMAENAAAAGLAIDRDRLEALANGAIPARPKRGGPGRLLRRSIGSTNGDEILHASAEQRFLYNTDYRPANLSRYLARDEQIQLPI